MIIAIDFDGTIVEHQYPAIGKPLPFAFETLLLLQKNGHQLILWSYRTGKKLEEAINFCEKRGLTFYAVNKSFPEEDFCQTTDSRKIHADLFIDDRNLGGIPSWGEIYQQICPEESGFKKQQKSGGLFVRLLKR